MKTLYLLRKPLHRIDPAIFIPAESQGDVVLLEESGERVFRYAGGSVFTLTGGELADGLTYDSLVRKIFECDNTVVI
jgi:hypothetical protein